MFSEVRHHPNVIARVGDNVSLNCTSPTDNPSSVTWTHGSNPSSTLLRIEGQQMSQFDTSGRLSVNHTAEDDFRLVIHQVQQTDSGVYKCSVDVGHENRHLTEIVVIGIKVIIDLLVD